MATAQQHYSPHALPLEVKRWLALVEIRTHHAMWHYVRVHWPNITPQRQVQLESAGFRPPRMRGDFLSGLDFLAMHRNMIRDLHMQFPNVSIPAGWDSIPFDPKDPEWPMPPSYSGIPEPAWKEQAATKHFEQEAHRFPPLPKTGEATSLARHIYQGMSLDYLGRRIENGIHDWMHIHWSAKPWFQREEAQDINDVRNDWLASPYASHVNVHFWKIHGWINDRVDDWAKVNEVGNVDALLQDAFTGPEMSGKMSHMIEMEMTPDEIDDSEAVFILSRNSSAA